MTDDECYDRGGRRRATTGVLYLFLAKIYPTYDECHDRGGRRRATTGVLYLFLAKIYMTDDECSIGVVGGVLQ